MPSTTITISTEAHQLLARLKQGNESFSEVILRHVRLPADTCAELLERIEKQGPPPIEPEILAALRSSRGRRSRRPARR
ncbi:MAG: antitoxin VapB family protein [Limisphaerales bacterium]